RNVMVNGIVLAEDGKKMSKRLNNYPDPALVMDKYGADALRAYLTASPVMQAENLNFSEKGVEESLRKNIMLLWNVYRFYEMFGSENDPSATSATKTKSANVLDQWLIAKLNLLIKEVTEAMEAYNLPKAMRPITEFIDEFSTWYLRRSRDRFKSEDIVDKNLALATTASALNSLAKLIAPFMPFMAENLWQRINAYDFKDENKSVHLEEWPKAGKIDSEILDKMSALRKIVELGLAKRDEAGIRIRQMLKTATVSCPKAQVIKDPAYLGLIKAELNIQTINFVTSEEDKLELVLDTALTPELKQEGIKRELIRSINLMRKEANLNLADRALIYYDAPAELAAMIETLKTELMKETLSSDIIKGAAGETKKAVKIDGQTINLSLKINN
ncbi:MAG: class I tRNA ligase family protein, partial [Candidatus Falkowbacteria bacterium]|nr:class I tRNA ligase family protein [Candidatus Falkowbacteria bacterium]